MGLWKWLGVSLVIPILGCSTEAPEGMIAAVGDRFISEEDLAHGVRKMYGEERSVESLGAADRGRVLDALIAAELLNLEGLRRGLDGDPEIREELDELERTLLVEEFYEREIGTEFEVGEEELRDRFEAMGSGEQIRLAHILCQREEEAEEILGKLAKGGDFAELARAHSRHTESAPGGGDMGYLGKGLVPPEVLPVVWEMPVGEIVPRPIHTRIGYHVVKVLDRRRQSLEEQRAGLELGLGNEKKRERERAVLSQIKQKYQLQWNPSIAELMAQRRELPEEQVLFHWRGGAFRAADYVRYAQVPQPIFRDTARIHRLAENLVMRELIRLEAVEAGYGKLDKVRRRVAEKQRELVVGKLSEAELSAAVENPQQLRAFYEENQEKYRGHPRVTIREIFVEDRSLADSLHGLIERGAAMGELARRFTRRSSLRDGNGLWEDVEPGDPRSAEIFRRALEGEGLLAPFKVPGGFSVVEVIDKKPGRILGFPEVENAVRGDVATVKMDAFIGRLRQRYAGEIRIFQE